MLRIIPNISASGAKTYYTSADYYTEGQELQGHWRGKGAQRSGLSGKVDREAWDALCDNRDPNTDLPLTVRQKQDRRVGYDFNFHAPKSLSLLYGLTNDQRLLDAFQASVGETMQEMEAEMQTRVRRSGANEDRNTGNMVWGEFTHFTSRPVDGVPDPHLHNHCFVFNSTWDPIEQRWKAGQFAGIKKDAPYFEAVFQSKLSDRIAELGLEVSRTPNGWEIGGFDKATITKFSRRTAEIEKLAREQGITSEAEKAELGAKTRKHKQKNLTMDELRTEWWSRMSGDEQRGVHVGRSKIGRQLVRDREHAAKNAAAKAIEHCFERDSVVPERKLLRDALRRSFGQASRNAVERAALGGDVIRAEHGGRKLVTTQLMLAEEQAVVRFARNGRGTCVRLGSENHVFRRDWLNDEQKKAVQHILRSSDRVILLRGRAGVGKTTLMNEAVEGIEAGGHNVFTFAPSAGASRGVLRSEGFSNADTVARLLADEKMQQQVRGQVLWVDEAGLLGMRTMKRVFDLADKIDARVILSGDDRQHGSVEAGAALRLLESEAGLVPAEIVQIHRQQAEYRQAVMALSEGRIEDGFRQLDAMGAIKEVGREERYKALAHEFVESHVLGKNTLVISPTHLEGEWVTEEIRTALRDCGMLGQEQRMFHTLENANLTVADRSDAVNLLPGDVLVYHQHAKGHLKGDRLVVGESPLALEQAARFTVYHPSLLPISPGDTIRITKNGETLDGKSLHNGDIFTVKMFTGQGDVELDNGAIVSQNFGHFTHGYVTTSHASQGKGEDKVIIAESSSSFGAASREQFYVSVSRGKFEISIYTDDREALMEAVCQSDERLTATEFAAAREHHELAMLAARMRDEHMSQSKTQEVRDHER